MNLSLSLLCDEDKNIIELYNLKNPFEHGGIARPATFIINPEGKICYRSIDGTASRVDLTDEFSFLEKFNKDTNHKMIVKPKKSWIIPSPKSNIQMTINMFALGSFADWKHFFTLPLGYLKIFGDKIKKRQFKCKEVDLSFLETAPIKFVNIVTLDSTPQRVFEVFEDPKAWPRWFKDIIKVEWTTPKPFGVGTTRVVTLKTMKAYEKFFIWETGKRFAFYFTATSIPFAKAFCEDYQLEELGDGKTKFTYTVVYEPNLLLKMTGPIVKLILGNMFKKSVISLATYIKGLE